MARGNLAESKRLEYWTAAESKETRRFHERVRQHWQNVKENRAYPRKEEIDPAAIAEMWDYCFMVDMRGASVEQGGAYEYVGARLQEAYGMDMGGVARCNAAMAPHVAMMLRQFGEVVESGEPASHEAEFQNMKGVLIKYRCCLLPLGNGKVEHILGCMRWKSL